MESDIKLPIAEIFTSIHGEGYWAGTPMTFIRLAGCSVGKFYPIDHDESDPFPMLPDGSQAFKCTAFDGHTFPCDTNYRKTDSLSVQEIYAQIPKHIKHVCITGGEPLMHGEKLTILGNYLSKFHKHIETSGTIDFRDFGEGQTYVTCSPKYDYLPDFIKDADEIRIMVGEGLKGNALKQLMGCINPKYQYVYFSPLCIADTTKPDPKSLEMCMDLVMQYPDTAISIQMHKVLGVR